MGFTRGAFEDGGQQANSKDPPGYRRFDDSARGASPSGKSTDHFDIAPTTRRRPKKIHDHDVMKALSRETEMFVAITAMHGVRRVWESHGWSKALWLAVVIVLGGALTWQLYEIVKRFSDQPTLSQVSFLIAEQGLLFPKITICNYNPLRKTFLREINKTGDFSVALAGYMLAANNDVLATYGNKFEADLQKDDVEMSKYLMAHPEFSINEFYAHAGFPCSDVLKMCSFAGRQIDCCDHAESVLTSLGRCQVLNLQAAPYEWMRKQTEGSESAGLQIVLDTRLDEQPAGIVEPNPSFNDQFENGFRLYIDEPETGTYASSQGISVSPGDVIYAAMSAKKYALLDKDNWGNCTSKWPKGYSGYNTLLKYQSKDCITKCKAKFFNDNCACSPFVYNIDGEFKSCTPLQTYQCIRNHIVVHHNETREEFVWPECTECVLECDRWEYSTYNSYGRGFSNEAVSSLTRLNGNWTPGYIRENIISLNVFFREMTYVEYAQVPTTTLTETLSNMGGTMGLFLGMSVLTVIESAIYLTKVLWLGVCCRRREYTAQKRRDQQMEAREKEAAVQSVRALSAYDLVAYARGQDQEIELEIPCEQLRGSSGGGTNCIVRAKILNRGSPENARARPLPVVWTSDSLNGQDNTAYPYDRL